MKVSDGMTTVVLTVGPDHTLRDAARLMSERRVGAAVVLDPDSPGPAIVTERDILLSIGAGEDPDSEKVCDHLTGKTVYAAPTWSLEEAAVTMVKGAFRHLVVMDGSECVGLVSMRDIVRCWTDDGSSCDLPGSAREHFEAAAAT